jgi:hypothetical protein
MFGVIQFSSQDGKQEGENNRLEQFCSVLQFRLLAICNRPVIMDQEDSLSIKRKIVHTVV